MAVIAYVDDRGRVKVEDYSDWRDGWEEEFQNDYLNEVSEEWLEDNGDWSDRETLDLFDQVDMNQNGKGDTPRPVDRMKYEKNHDEIFGSPKHVCKDFVKDLNTKARVCYHCGEPEIRRLP